MVEADRHILIIVDSIDINDSSASKGRVALINNLAKAGFNLTVLHFTRKIIKLDTIKCVAIKEKKLNYLYVLSRLQRVIQRVFKINLAQYIEPLFGFSFTFFNDVNSIKSELKNVDISKIDFVLTLSKAASFRPHYAINDLPEFHKKWIAYVHDPFPFSCYPFPYDWKEPGFKIKEKFFHEVAKNAKYSAFPSLLLKEWMGDFFENFNKTGMVIPHQNFKLEIKDIQSPDFFNKNKFNVLHAGNLMKPRNPEGLLKGFQLFLKNTPSAVEDSNLLLIGNAEYHRHLIEYYNNKISGLYANLKSLPFKNVYWLQQHVSVNVILEAKAKVSPFLPGKFPHCIAANKAILHLGPEKSEVLRLLGEDYQYHAEIDDFNAIASKIRDLYIEWKTNKEGFQLNRKDIENYISPSYLKEQIINLYNE